MKIGFDAKRAFKNSTGLGNYSRILIGGIAESNQDVIGLLYTPDTEGQYSKYFSLYSNFRVIQPSSVFKFFPRLWRSFGVSLRAKSDGIKIYHGLSNELPCFIPKNVKKIVTVHDLIVFRYPELYSKIDRKIYQRKIRRSCATADVIVAVSQQTKFDLQEILKVPEEKIRVICQSCDSMFWNPESPEAKNEVRRRYKLPEKYIVSVGSIEPRKNQIAQVKALSKLPDDLHLVIVGASHNDKYYDRLVETVFMLKLSKRVHILDKAVFDDFPAIYANALMSMYVSEFEGFGIPILESLCCNTPVITSNISSMPEVGGDAALYVNPKDVNDIAEKAMMLYNDAELRQQLVEKGKKQREKFSEQLITQKMIDLYEQLYYVGRKEEEWG